MNSGSQLRRFFQAVLDKLYKVVGVNFGDGIEMEVDSIELVVSFGVIEVELRFVLSNELENDECD